MWNSVELYLLCKIRLRYWCSQMRAPNYRASLKCKREGAHSISDIRKPTVLRRACGGTAWAHGGLGRGRAETTKCGLAGQEQLST